MGVYTITDKGKALQAKVMAGKCKYAFTKMALGDGYVSTQKDYATMNDLTRKVMDFPISLILADGASCEVRGTISNASIETAFYVRELGLYATDPDEGEILYCAHYYDMPSAIDAASSGPYEKEFTIKIDVETADEVDITVPQTGFVTRADVEALIALAMKNALIATVAEETASEG